VAHESGFEYLKLQIYTFPVEGDLIHV